jgi:hypothetical protein
VLFHSLYTSYAIDDTCAIPRFVCMVLVNSAMQYKFRKGVMIDCTDIFKNDMMFNNEWNALYQLYQVSFELKITNYSSLV